LSSRIRKKAPATEKAETIKARVAVGVGGASRLKLRKMATSQQTTTTSSGGESGVHAGWGFLSVLRSAAWP